MAGTLKQTGSFLLSPKFLSPRVNRTLAQYVAKSDEKTKFRQYLSPKKVARRLDFCPTPLGPERSSNRNVHLAIPDIKLEKIESSESGALKINTPIKQDLAENGLYSHRNDVVILGRGTFGTVFKGEYKGKTVAVKIVASQDTERERNLVGLSHKNIVQLLEIVESARNYDLIVMEYLEKVQNLQEVLSNIEQHTSSLTLSLKLKQFALDITNGLNYLHNNQVAHLDLKPKNILVENGSYCKLCDFGNSIRLGGKSENFNHLGTIVYTAPEILLGKQPTEKCDIYSLGLIFWQFKYRKDVFEEYNLPSTIVYNVIKKNMRPKCREGVFDGLTKLFLQCWDSDPESRPGTSQILEQLESINCLDFVK